MTEPIGDETARTLRKLWFDYLDTMEPLRPKLHIFCLQLTGSVWDAEDLVQDTLLRGFGAIGRGDMHTPATEGGGPGRRWVEKPKAYLCQIATNLWIDRLRRQQREALQADVDAGAHAPPPIITPAAGAALFGRTSPQERAAVVLKDVFDFSLDDIAQMLSTTAGAVKTALHRAREKLDEERTAMPFRNSPASAELIDRFIAAFNARDVPATVALLLESVTYEVQGVGGERGTKTIWLTVAFRNGIVAERRTVDGERVVAFIFAARGKRYLGSLWRFEEVGGRISRIVNYTFCPETIALVASELGLTPWSSGYHQTGETLARMIATSGLPWADSRAVH
jgi:RNA polymerase sigma-70 factor (ECF subfamily)